MRVARNFPIGRGLQYYPGHMALSCRQYLHRFSMHSKVHESVAWVVLRWKAIGVEQEQRQHPEKREDLTVIDLSQTGIGGGPWMVRCSS
jgi:hypothetical protein